MQAFPYVNNSLTITVKSIVNTLLDSYLGVFANGEKAIWVNPPIPPEFGQGVHCVIDRNSKRVGATSRFEQSVALIFVPSNIDAVDEANYQLFDKSLKLMRDRFPVSREIHTNYQGFYPQTTFQLIYNWECYR